MINVRLVLHTVTQECPPPVPGTALGCCSVLMGVVRGSLTVVAGWKPTEVLTLESVMWVLSACSIPAPFSVLG